MYLFAVLADDYMTKSIPFQRLQLFVTVLCWYFIYWSSPMVGSHFILPHLISRSKFCSLLHL